MIIDSFIFNDEIEMLQFRLRLLWNKVDKFIVVEGNHTHSGNPKPINLLGKFVDELQWAEEKLITYPVRIDTANLDFSYRPKEYDPNAPQWKVEHQQRNAIINACRKFSDNDTLMLSDCDEIPSYGAIEFFRNTKFTYPVSCDQIIVPYGLNYVRSDIGWRGTVACSLGYCRQEGPQILRDLRTKYPPIPYGGWHLTYFGGAEQIKKKLESFAHAELNRPSLTDADYIKYCFDHEIDFLTGNATLLTKVGKEIYPEYFLKYALEKWWL